MRLQVTWVSEGPGPSEVVVQVSTSENGSEQLVVHNTAVMDDTIDIGFPIHQEDDNWLIELPRETVRGQWRIWVPKGSVVSSDIDGP